MKVQRIVLVDDNEADNVYHEVVLRRAGFDGDLQVFEMATDALEYLRALPDGPVCLVLLDINMPGMDGWEFATAAAPLLVEKPTLMLVMLTSSSAPEDMARARSMPELAGFITKPLTVEEAHRLLAGKYGA
jgi:CheY-like chemotaxis protein